MNVPGGPPRYLQTHMAEGRKTRTGWESVSKDKGECYGRPAVADGVQLESPVKPPENMNVEAPGGWRMQSGLRKGV